MKVQTPASRMVDYEERRKITPAQSKQRRKQLGETGGVWSILRIKISPLPHGWTKKLKARR
jgi:hypothetical protein